MVVYYGCFILFVVFCCDEAACHEIHPFFPPPTAHLPCGLLFRALQPSRELHALLAHAVPLGGHQHLGLVKRVSRERLAMERSR